MPKNLLSCHVSYEGIHHERTTMSKIMLTLCALTISALLILPISTQAALQTTKTIQASGTIQYISYEAQLGLWSASSPETVPDDAQWVVAGNPEYVKPRSNVQTILNWYDLRPAYPNGVNNAIVNETDIKSVESSLKSISVSNFWGIIGPIGEEYFRSHIQFSDDLNTTWFNEVLMGYTVYAASHPGITRNQWQDEMFLRFMRGFTDYFHGRGLAVGTTVSDGALVDRADFYGAPAFSYIQQDLDFVFLYAYTENLDDFQQRISTFYSLIDQLLPNLQQFWILTRSYDFSLTTWEVEAKALELKNCFDRDMIITTSIYEDQPTFLETWALIEQAIQLYGEGAPYFENYVQGQNLLTGQTGQTYGWVQLTT